MRAAIILRTTLVLAGWFGLVLLVPAAVEAGFGDRHGALGFLIAAGVAGALGLASLLVPGRGFALRRMEGLAVVASSWLLLVLLGAIPFAWHGLGPEDALFESMSGLTGTGATILADFDGVSPGIFFWRSFSEWVGSMGIIALFIAILPALRVAGRQMFFAEAPGPTEERITPRIRNTAVALYSLYVGLTVLETILLLRFGMPFFDAVCNALSTVSAGGFSPHPASIGGYGSSAIEWTVMVFMLLAGANYAFQFQALRGRPLTLLRSEEFRLYLVIVLAATLLLIVILKDDGVSRWEWISGAAWSEETLRRAGFQALTIITTTGFATEDFALWPAAGQTILLLLMFCGGCGGSAAGGPKLVRLWLVAKSTLFELFRTVHPRAVRPLRLDGRRAPADALSAVVSFLLLYLLLFAASVGVVGLSGADLKTAITASIATLGNIGPGLGQVGPFGSYADFPAVIKVWLSLNMWIGRLEIVTVLIFLHPAAWRGIRWRQDDRGGPPPRRRPQARGGP